MHTMYTAPHAAFSSSSCALQHYEQQQACRLPLQQQQHQQQQQQLSRCRAARQQQRRPSKRQHAEPPNRDFIPPPPMPPPPPPPGQQQQQQPGGFQQQQQPQYSSATPKFQELGWREIKDRYVRPSYLPASFALGALTIGLRLGAANYTFTDNPFEYLGTAVSTGVMFMALAWVLFDFGEDPPSSSGGSGLSGGPRK